MSQQELCNYDSICTYLELIEREPNGYLVPLPMEILASSVFRIDLVPYHPLRDHSVYALCVLVRPKAQSTGYKGGNLGLPSRDLSLGGAMTVIEMVSLDGIGSIVKNANTSRPCGLRCEGFEAFYDTLLCISKTTSPNLSALISQRGQWKAFDALRRLLIQVVKNILCFVR